MLNGIDHFLKQHCGTLDADVFSGDALSYLENRTMLETYIGRWSRAIISYTEPQVTPAIDVLHITSEPGDGSHYDYLVYRDGPDEFCFMPGRSTFKFPQRLNFYAIQSADSSAIHLLAVEHNCNTWTIIECIRIMKELHK